MDMASQGFSTPTEGTEDSEKYASMRSAERFKLMMRTAKLVSSVGETLCVIRDVSATGVRLRLFHDLTDDGRFTLELANGDRFDMDKMWAANSEAGFRFVEDIDVAKFLTEDSPYPKRQIRLRTRLHAIINCGNVSSTAIIKNISQQGAGIEISRHLAMTQRVRLDVEGLPTVYASVRWRSHPNYGLAFENVFKMDEFARLIWAIHLRGSPDVS